MSKHFNNLKLEKLPDSSAVITGEITVEFLKECRSEALQSLGNRSSLPGFRPGHIPEEVLMKNIGEMPVLEETAEVALGREYGNIVREMKIVPVARPQVAITKLAPGIPLEFKITVAVEPEFTLPDYKKIAEEVAATKETLEITDKEIDDVVEEIKKQDLKTGLQEGEDLRGKVKENLLKEKEFRNAEKKRLTLVENLVKATEIPVPGALVNSEIEKMLLQFKDDVSRMGAKFDEYLKQVNKTEEEIKAEWQPKAVERVKAELIMAKIAQTEKLEPEPADLDHEAKHLLEHYPEADPLRVRLYLYGQMRNQKVLEFLEGKK